MAEDDAPVREREARRGLDVLLAPLDQRAAAHRAGVVGPLHEHQGDDDLVDALAEDRDEDQGDEDRGKAELPIHHPHDHGVHAPAVVRREQAHAHPDEQRDDPAHHPHPEADAQAVGDRAQHVAARAVTAQQEGDLAGPGLPSRRHPRVHHVHDREIVGVLGREPRRRHRDEEHEGQHPGRGLRHVALEEGPEEAAERRLFPSGVPVAGHDRNAGSGAHLHVLTPSRP